MSSEQERQRKYESVYVTPEYSQLLADTSRIAKEKEAAESLEYVNLITEAPPGYYYKAEDVEAHNRQALEYNKKLREYKLQLSKAEMDVKLGILSLESYEAQRKLALMELERTAPDRAAFLEYLKGIGPPEMTKEQRERVEKGLPLEGIPGPGAGPKPGSIGAYLQETVQPYTSEALKATERPYQMITQPLRKTAADIENRSLESAAKGSAAIGFTEYMAAKGINVAAAAFDVATYEFRPQLWGEVSRTIGGAVFDPKTQEQIAKYVIHDPFGAATEIGGGWYFGGKLISFTEQLPGKIRRLKASYDWTRYGDEELFRVAEMEMGMQFPEEIMSYETSRTLYKLSSVKLSSLTGGVSVELPYYSETMPELEKVTQQILDKAEEWAPRQITKRTDTALGYGPLEGEYGFLKAEGRMGGMKPFKEPTVEIPTRSEQITVLTEKGIASSPIKSMFKQVDRMLENVQTEPVTSYLKPVQFKDVLTLPTIRAPEFSFKSFEALAPIAGVKAVEFSDTRIINQLKSFDAQITKTLQRSLSLEVEIPKLGTPQIPKIGEYPIQTPVQEPKATQIQIPKFSVPQIQIQEPKLDIPVVPGIPRFPIIPTQPRPRVVIKKEIEGKGKRKGKKRKREAWELRADKVFSFKFKEPKIKGMEL